MAPRHSGLTRMPVWPSVRSSMPAMLPAAPACQRGHGVKLRQLAGSAARGDRQSVQAPPERSADRSPRARRCVVVRNSALVEDHDRLAPPRHSRGRGQERAGRCHSDHGVACSRHHQQPRPSRNTPRVNGRDPRWKAEDRPPRKHRKDRCGGRQAPPRGACRIVGGERRSGRMPRHHQAPVSHRSETEGAPDTHQGAIQRPIGPPEARSLIPGEDDRLSVGGEMPQPGLVGLRTAYAPTVQEDRRRTGTRGIGTSVDNRPAGATADREAHDRPPWRIWIIASQKPRRGGRTG